MVENHDDQPYSQSKVNVAYLFLCLDEVFSSFLNRLWQREIMATTTAVLMKLVITCSLAP